MFASIISQSLAYDTYSEIVCSSLKNIKVFKMPSLDIVFKMQSLDMRSLKVVLI